MTCSARSFGIALELLGEDLVLRGRRAARPGAGDRMRRQLVALDLEQQLRAGADDLEARHPDEEQVRARVDPAERAVELDAVERPAVAGPIGRSNDWRRARTTWIASPAAIASLATSTAWTYSSRPRLVSDRGRGGVRRPPTPLPASPRRAPAGQLRALGRAVRSRASKMARSAIR